MHGFRGMGDCEDEGGGVGKCGIFDAYLATC